MHASINDKWKDKYLRGLDELETKEKVWQEAENLLRQAIGRLAHTGYGVDSALDKQLDRVREAVRGRKDARALNKLVREASATAVDAQERNRQQGAETGEFLAQFLAQLTFDGTRCCCRSKSATMCRGFG